MATFKHISSKNADYGAAEAYLTFEHDEFTMKPTLDENGRLIPREDYRISSLNCGGEDFAVACMRANLRYEKNQKREDVKSHHYIISFDPRDGTDNGLTVDRAQELGEQFCKEHFPGHQALVCTHPDGHNHSGNIHVHIVINSLRIYEVPLLPYMDRPADTREGCKHRCTNAAMEYFKSEVMEMCHREGLYQIDLLNGSKERITEREYWAAKKGQLALDKENAAREAAGQPTKPTKFETDKAKLRRTIRQALSQAASFDEFSSLLLQEGVTVKESRGRLYRDLLSVKTVSVNNRKPTSEYLTPHTVREIHKLLRSAFNQAVRWELISRNPVLNATLPKEEHKERDIWTAETLSKAMEVCDDPILSLALNLAFSCSLRIGEMLGLTWDCIDIAPQSIENGSAYIFVNKELQRVTRGALDDLSDKGVIKKFPPCIASTHTALVLKEPKTKTSIRRVYLPKTVAYMLVERKKEIDELMDLFGDEYIDNNLVFCSSNGRPMESQVINRAFNKLIKENGLPHVVFHSLRHSSITYKLKLNGGDMKSVQGDSGHAQVKMVADVYSHIIDEDRCINAQRLEEAFYSSKTPDPVEDTEPKTADTAVTESDESDAAKILELLKNPETAALLKQLAKAL